MGQPSLSAAAFLQGGHFPALAAMAIALFGGACSAQEAPSPEIINPASHYPEGALKLGNQLFYAEMPKDRIMAWDGTANSVFWNQHACGPTSIAPRGDQALLIACHMSHTLVEIPLDKEGLPSLEKQANATRIRRPNDTISDAKGGTYISSSGEFSKNYPSSGAVYYLDAGGELLRVAGDIWYANGLVISPDGRTLYVSEHLGGNILAFSISEDGRLYDRRTEIDISEYADTDNPYIRYIGPDGLSMDREGRLYVCIYGGAEILIFGPDRALQHRIQVDETYITNIDLSADEKTLFITAPAENNTPEMAGRVYALDNPAN